MRVDARLRVLTTGLVLLLVAGCGANTASTKAESGSPTSDASSAFSAEAVPTKPPPARSTPKNTASSPVVSPKPVSTPKTTPKPASVPSCSASAKYPHAAGGTQTVYVKSNQFNKSVTLTIHYKSKDSSYSGTTNASGSATISFGVGRPSKGYTVVIDVDAGTAHCSTNWTPQ